MGLLVEFDVVDDFGFIDSTEEFGIIPDYAEGCEVFVEAFILASRELVPVDTGYLKKSLSAESFDTECSAWTDCDYAQYVEFGTWCQSPQPYFEPALAIAIKQAEPYWQQAQEEALMEEEMLIEEMEEEEEAQSGRGQAGRGTFGGGATRMGFGGLIGWLVGLFITAVVMVTIENFFDLLSPGDRDGSGRSRGGGGGGDGRAYIPDIIIT